MQPESCLLVYFVSSESTFFSVSSMRFSKASDMCQIIQTRLWLHSVFFATITIGSMSYQEEIFGLWLIRVRELCI